MTGAPESDARVGWEATGVIEAVGADVAGLTAGMRVSVFPAPGAWAERITADARFVVPVPDTVSDEVAAQMLINPLTMLMLRREADKHFTTAYDGILLNNAAGGAVGRLLTAVLSHHRIPTISLVRRTQTAQRLRERFPEISVVVTEDNGWVDTVAALTHGRTVGVAFDPIGGTLTADLVKLLSPGGTVVLYGRMAEEPITIAAASLLSSAFTLRGVTLGRWVEAVAPERRASDVATAGAVAWALADQFDVAAIYPINEISDAIRHAMKPGTLGSVLVRPNAVPVEKP